MERCCNVDSRGPDCVNDMRVSLVIRGRTVAEQVVIPGQLDILALAPALTANSPSGSSKRSVTLA